MLSLAACCRVRVAESSEAQAQAQATRDEQARAVVRGTVPMGELSEFFPRAIATPMAAGAA